MSGNARWIRLNVGWSSSDWLVVLRPASRLAWVELLTYTKVHGKAGSVRALSALAAGKKWSIPTKDVQAMLDAAHAGEDPALKTENGDWIVVNWTAYQEPDRTSADRQARFRDRHGVTGHNGPVTAHNAVSKEEGGSSTDDDPESITALSAVTPPLSVTRPPTLDPQTSTSPAEGAKNGRRRPEVALPHGWAPSDLHQERARQLGLDVGAQAERFRSHAETHDRRARNWDAAFTNWLLNPLAQNGNGRPKKKRVVAPDGTILSA